MDIKTEADMVGMSLDLAMYKKVAFNELLALNERAGRAWLNAIIKETPIPAWSGASRATFLKVARLLGTSVPISIAPGAPNRIAMGKSSSQGRLIKDKGKVIVGFEYKSSLGHLNYNEYNRAVAGKSYPQPWSNNVRYTPYFFQQRGSTAWKAVAVTARLPNPFNYLKRIKL